MKKILGLATVVLLLGTLGFGAWWSWPLLFPSIDTGTMGWLVKTDSALIQGRLEDAKNTILQNLPEDASATEWLKIEKRAWEIGRRSGNWQWAIDLSDKAVRQFPGNSGVAAFRTWVLLKSGKPQDASKLAQEKLIGSGFTTLTLQSRVETEAFPLLSTSQKSLGWEGLLAELQAPESTSAALYKKLTELSDDPTLQRQALLSALVQGRLDSAQNYLSSLKLSERNRPPFDRLQALLAYDSGDWLRAGALLRNVVSPNIETYLVLADVYLHLGDLEEAKIIYDQLLRDYRSSTKLPAVLFLNRATIAVVQKEPEKAMELLKTALGMEPSRSPAQGDSNQIVAMKLLFLETRFLLGESDGVKTRLEQLIGDPADKAESEYALLAELLKDRLYPDLQSIPRLWSLFHRHPQVAPLTERLLWSLIETEDEKKAEQVIQIYSQKNPGEFPWWLSYYTGLLAGLEQDYDKAAETLKQVPPAWRDFSLYYNWGLIEQTRAYRVSDKERLEALENAWDDYSKSLDLLPLGADLSARALRSKILTQRGEIQIALIPLKAPSSRNQIKDLGLQDFQKAVELDPDNLKAAFLLREASVSNDKDTHRDQTQKP